MSEQNQANNPLESIKNEISNNLNGGQKKPISWNSAIITVALGVLTIVSLAQMMSSIKIFNKLKGGQVNAATSAPQNSYIENQPDMVGGC